MSARGGLAALVVVALGGAAAADSAKPPAGWTADTPRALSLSQQLGAVPHFGGRPGIVTAQAYRAPAGGALYVTRVLGNVDEAQRSAAASAEVDELRAALRRSGDVAPTTWTRRATDDRLLEGRLAWRDPASGLANDSRIVVAADAQHVIAVSGECVLALDAPPEVTTACHDALATLDPGVAPADRLPLVLAAETAPVPPVGAAGTSPPSAPSIRDAGGPGFAPITIPPDQPAPADRRPVYLGIGLVLLAIVFWWNQRRRERFDRASEGPGAGGGRDRDRDDLHAAADDDEPQPKREP